jgi:copper(I)-binding protein
MIASLLLLASCGGSGAPNIQIKDAWARATVAGQSGTAAYMIIENHGSGEDRLVEVTGPPPIVASIHETTTSGGVSSMRELADGLAIPVRGTATLKPGGTHVMLSGLTAPLRPGETMRLELRFERSGRKNVDVKIASTTDGMSH